VEFDLIISNGNLINGSCFQRKDIGVTNGIISVLAKPGQLEKKMAKREIDATGKLIIPGAIDSHVHMREPGFTTKEDFSTGTKAAAAGGVTTVMVMPFNQPFTFSDKELEEKARIADGKAVVDFVLQAAVNPFSLTDIKKAANWGAASFELFLADAPDKLQITDNGVLSAVFLAIKEVGAIVGLYADDDSLIQEATTKLKKLSDCSFLNYGKSRPPIGEVLAIMRSSLLAEYLGVQLHLRQISTGKGLEVCRYMKNRYDGITVEVSPHHLLLDEGIMSTLGSFAKVNPPLRKIEDRELLWSGLHDGTIDFIATDHAPHTPEEKKRGYNNLWHAPGGIIGLQTLLPLMINEVLSGNLSFSLLVKLLCENPARRFGLYPRKGIIEIDSDADLVIIDLEKELTIKTEDQYSKAKYTPFEGKRLKGRPVYTLVRGNVVMKDGKVGDFAYGKLIKP